MSPIRSVGVSYAPDAALPLAKGTETSFPNLEWRAVYKDKIPVITNSTSQVLSVRRYEFINDLKAKFMSLQKAMKLRAEKSIAKDDIHGVTKKRRPRTAFILYRSVLQRHPEYNGMPQTELSLLISALWKNKHQETRAQFERLAELEKSKWIVLQVY